MNQREDPVMDATVQKHVSPFGTTMPRLTELGLDLTAVSVGGKMLVLFRPVVLMLGYVALALKGWWIPALAVFSLGYLSLVVTIHDLCHRALQLSRNINQFCLSIAGIMGQVSGSAIQATHLVHHRNFSAAFAGTLDDGVSVYDEDPETTFGGKPLWRAIAMSPVYQLSLWRWTRKQRAALRKRVALEALGHAILGVASVILLKWTLVPFVYMAGVFFYSMVFPVANIKLFHDVKETDVLDSTRSLHGPVPWLTMGLSDHLEHHIYPQVPSLHTRELARRIRQPLEALQHPATATAMATAETR
jgi:beta-carotene hydroxylase